MEDILRKLLDVDSPRHQVLASHRVRGHDAETVSTLDSGAHPEWHPGLGSGEDIGPEG